MDCLASVDFFVVPTATFRLLFVFIVRPHERRHIVHFGVTAHLSIPKIPSGRIRRDSEHCDMIWIADRVLESAVVVRWIEIQVT